MVPSPLTPESMRMSSFSYELIPRLPEVSALSISLFSFPPSRRGWTSPPGSPFPLPFFVCYYDASGPLYLKEDGKNFPTYGTVFRRLFFFSA